MPQNFKILLALDGSEPSMTAVQYASRVLSKKTDIVLFHVAAEVPEAFRDLDVDPLSGYDAYPLHVWKIHQQEIIAEFMGNARRMLIDSGFAEERISIKTQHLISGIARDIHNESWQEYSALVMGRNGFGRVNDILMGSVSSKIVELTSHLPVAVVGHRPQSNKILVAFDGSKGSMKSVEFIGTLLDSTKCEVSLCHVIRPLGTGQFSTKELFIQKHEAQWIEASKRKIVPAISKAQRRLKDAGFAEDRISSKILTYETSRAAAIVRAAAAGGCDTIVMGRRGFTSVGEFRIGRVSRKILHLTFQAALWVVS